ncbi:MAG: LysR family transcriptional regulator substrate-binding protein, partial [Bdellovibrionales bacterium]|nr:LysR family transcriptional regulator substrate-binding protein [Oligoflexia bacterium]
FFQNLNQHAPKIEISLVHDFSRKVTERIVSYDIDLGFVINPVRHPDLVLKKLGNDQIRFWKKKGHSNPPKRIFADSNLNQMAILLGKTYAKYFSDWSLVETASLELIRTLVSQGHGIGILPERIANAEGFDLVAFDKALPSYADEIYLAYRREVLASRAGKELIRLAHLNLPQ